LESRPLSAKAAKRAQDVRRSREGYFFFLLFLAFFLGAFFAAAFFFLATVRPPKRVSARFVLVTSWSRVNSRESHPEQKQAFAEHDIVVAQRRLNTLKFRKELHTFVHTSPKCAT
jgi:hypothetical protein